MSKEEIEWYEKGYNDQEWGYPLLDHVWKKKTWFRRNTKYPLEYKKFYREGQLDAWNNGCKECPHFLR